MGRRAEICEVGGPDMPVVLVGREAGSGTRDGFESIVDVKDACKYDQELTSTGAVIAGVAANPNAFGYASLSAVDDTVKAVTVEGVAASEATVQDGTYKIQRPFVFVTKDGAELSEAAQAFIEFATSEKGTVGFENLIDVPSSFFTKLSIDFINIIHFFNSIRRICDLIMF